MDREHTRFLKQLRRERCSMFALLIALAIDICILPFVYSPNLIMLMLGILAFFYGQSILVMVMD